MEKICLRKELEKKREMKIKRRALYKILEETDVEDEAEA